MALAIAAAPAATTIALFAGEPLFAAGLKVVDRFKADHPTAADWADTVLRGGAYGFGCLTLAASLSPQIALLPGMAYGALGGAILFAAWKAIKAAHTWMLKQAWYVKTIKKVKGLSRFVPSFIKDIVNTVVDAGRFAIGVAGFFGRSKLIHGSIVDSTYMPANPMYRNIAGAAALASSYSTMGVLVPNGNQGQVLKSMSYAAPVASRVGSYGLVGTSMVADLAYRQGWTPMTFSSTPIFGRFAATSSTLFRGLFAISSLAFLWGSLSLMALVQKTRDEEQSYRATFEAMVAAEEKEAADKVREAAKAAEAAHTAHLDEDATARVNANAAAMATVVTSDPLIAPLQDAEVGAAGTMTRAQAEQALIDSASHAASQRRKPGRPVGSKNARKS